MFETKPNQRRIESLVTIFKFGVPHPSRFLWLLTAYSKHEALAGATFQLRQTLKRPPQELFETAQRNEIKGFISGHVHILTTSIHKPRNYGATI